MTGRAPRTLLEHRIRQRHMTYEEFVQHAETFARDHHEPGTLSLRHLQRLTSGQPFGTLRPATARLLENLFGEPIATLLAPPTTVFDEDRDPGSELRRLLDAARRVDPSTVALLHQQLDAIRRLDRQLGAIVVRDELNVKIRQVERLTTYSLAPGTREPLAGLLSEMHTLAGWQALDLGDLLDSWQHYEHSRGTAAQSGSIPLPSPCCRRTSIRPHRRRSNSRRSRPTRQRPASRRHQRTAHPASLARRRPRRSPRRPR